MDSRITPNRISDSIWLANGSLLVAAGHQMLLFGRSNREDRDQSQDLFQFVAGHNGPLIDYHPQMLLQCLLWGECENSICRAKSNDYGNSR